jgi:Domain of unknown function (DUF4340)
MGPKLFAGLALLTLLTTAAAIVVALRQPTATPVDYLDEPAFPELRADPDAVTKVTIETPDGAFSLVRQSADRWVAPERFDYLVAGDEVRDLIVGLADMRLVEPKTSRPERYERLELRDLDAEGSKSRLVRLESADGEVLAEALIGKQRARLTGQQSSGTYIRRPGEAQTWLASGSAQPELKVEEWLDDEVVALSGDSLRRVEVTPAQDEGYTIVRDAKGGDLRLEGLAQNEQIKPDADLGRLANALSSVTMEDVRPRDEVDWPDAHPTARFVTFDGLQVTVRLAKIGEEHFAAFDAEQVEPAGVVKEDAEDKATAAAAASEGSGAEKGGAVATDKTGPAGARAAESPATAAAASEAPETETTDVNTSGTETTAEASEDSAPDAAEDQPAEESASNPGADEAKPDAATLQAKLGKWAYRIPEFLFNRLTTARSDLVQQKDGTS